MICATDWLADLVILKLSWSYNFTHSLLSTSVHDGLILPPPPPSGTLGHISPIAPVSLFCFGSNILWYHAGPKSGHELNIFIQYARFDYDYHRQFYFSWHIKTMKTGRRWRFWWECTAHDQILHIEDPHWNENVIIEFATWLCILCELRLRHDMSLDLSCVRDANIISQWDHGGITHVTEA